MEDLLSGRPDESYAEYMQRVTQWLSSQPYFGLPEGPQEQRGLQQGMLPEYTNLQDQNQASYYPFVYVHPDAMGSTHGRSEDNGQESSRKSEDAAQSRSAPGGKASSYVAQGNSASSGGYSSSYQRASTIPSHVPPQVQSPQVSAQAHSAHSYGEAQAAAVTTSGSSSRPVAPQGGPNRGITFGNEGSVPTSYVSTMSSGRQEGNFVGSMAQAPGSMWSAATPQHSSSRMNIPSSMATSTVSTSSLSPSFDATSLSVDSGRHPVGSRPHMTAGGDQQSSRVSQSQSVGPTSEATRQDHSRERSAAGVPSQAHAEHAHYGSSAEYGRYNIDESNERLRREMEQFYQQQFYHMQMYSPEMMQLMSSYGLGFGMMDNSNNPHMVAYLQRMLFEQMQMQQMQQMQQMGQMGPLMDAPGLFYVPMEHYGMQQMQSPYAMGAAGGSQVVEIKQPGKPTETRIGASKKNKVKDEDKKKKPTATKKLPTKSKKKKGSEASTPTAAASPGTPSTPVKSIKKAPKKAVPTKTPREMSVLKGEWRILNADMESIIERSSNCILPSPEEKAARARKRISNVRPYSSWFYPVFWEKMPCTDEEALRDLRNMRSKLTAEERKRIDPMPSTSSGNPNGSLKPREKSKDDGRKDVKSKGNKKRKVDEEEETVHEEGGKWVCCDKCDKWRRVPQDYDLTEFQSSKRKWYCSMNPDKKRNRCQVPEDDWS